MTLRRKFVTAFAAVAAVVAVTIGWVAYGTTERALHNEINVSLATAVTTLAAGGSLSTISLAGTQERTGDDHHDDGPSTISETAQSVSSNGVVTHLSGAATTLPVSPEALRIAEGPTAGLRVVDQATVGHTTYQVLTQSLGGASGSTGRSPAVR